MRTKSNLQNFIILGIIFSLLGAITCFNYVLIPLLKHKLNASYLTISLIPTVFFIAYFIGGLALLIYAKFIYNKNTHFMCRRILTIGLLLSGFGCMIFGHYIVILSYFKSLIGLATVGIGFCFIQVSANPLVQAIEYKNLIRNLNLLQGLNSMANIAAPLLGATILYFSLFQYIIGRISSLYMFTGVFILVIAYLVHTKLDIDLELHIPKTINLSKSEIFLVIKDILAIFFCVGLEVSIASNLVLYLQKSFYTNPIYLHQSLNHKFLELKLLSIHWGGFMLGRFLVFIAMGQQATYYKIIKMIMIIILGILALASINNYFEIGIIYFALYLIIASLILIITQNNHKYTLIAFSAMSVFNLLIIIFISPNMLTLVSIVSMGIFSSLMFTNIFALAITRFEQYRGYISVLLIMMIIGGAIIPFLQGSIANIFGINKSFIAPLLAGLYMLYYSITLVNE